ncbi:TPA: hypothetical protein ACG6G1_003613, partial [Escherichia coli]
MRLCTTCSRITLYWSKDMTISNSNLLKPFITGTELPPFKEDVFSKTEEQFKKSPHGKLLFISGNEN